MIEQGLVETDRALAFESSPRLLRMRRLLTVPHVYLLSDLGRHDQAIAQAREELARGRADASAHPGDYGLAKNVLVSLRMVGEVQARGGKRTDACRSYRDTAVGWKELAASAAPSEFDRENQIKPIEGLLAECKPFLTAAG